MRKVLLLLLIIVIFGRLVRCPLRGGPLRIFGEGVALVVPLAHPLHDDLDVVACCLDVLAFTFPLHHLLPQHQDCNCFEDYDGCSPCACAVVPDMPEVKLVLISMLSQLYFKRLAGRQCINANKHH